MAPEQAAGDSQEIGPLADVHAMGAILFEVLTGRILFVGTTVMDTLHQVQNQEPIPPSRLQLHDGCSALFRRRERPLVPVRVSAILLPSISTSRGKWPCLHGAASNDFRKNLRTRA
jgi:hypothetical protein